MKRIITLSVIAALILCSCKDSKQTVDRTTTAATTAVTTIEEETTTTAETTAVIDDKPEPLTKDSTFEEITDRCKNAAIHIDYTNKRGNNRFFLSRNWESNPINDFSALGNDVETVGTYESNQYVEFTTSGFLYTDPTILDTVVEPEFDEGVPLRDFAVLGSPLNTDETYGNPYGFNYSKLKLHISKIESDSINAYGKPYHKVNIEEIEEPDGENITAYSLSFTADSAELYLSTEKEISLNAFIRMKDGKAEFLIDPAFMYDIPCNEIATYDINGKEAAMVTREITAENIPHILLSELNENYVYANITFSGIKIDCINDGATTREITAVNIIETDCEKAMNTVYLEEDNETEAGQLYNCIMKNRDSLFNENTKGLSFIDLDFDDHPEVLITDSFPTKIDDGKTTIQKTTTNIYRFENGSLRKIDTIYPYLRYRINPTLLTATTLEDGSRAWYHMTPVNHETGEYQCMSYLLKLNGDELEYTEVFRIDRQEDSDETDQYWYYGPLYFMGERFEHGNAFFDELYDMALKSNDGENNEISSWWGDGNTNLEDKSHTMASSGGNDGEFQLSEIARTIYAQRLNGESYSLLSDWMYRDEYYYGGNLINYLTDRMFAYNIAYAVDSAFMGEYNSALMAKKYNFIGAYGKPVIYLYPEEETELSVSLDFTYGGELTCTYPEYNNGWNITAMPDGTLYDENGDEYYCLYWEADGNAKFDSSKGFCVKGEDTAAFLREKLMYIGLSAREANEFIIYWLPKLQDNKYNVITLHTDDYADSVPLTLSVKPDTEIRVFMTYYSSDEFVGIEEQTLPHYERNGFTLVEWGGSEE